MKYFYLLVACVLLAACQEEPLPADDSTIEQEKVYISLSLGGDLGSVRFEDAPLGGRVASEEDSTYIIVFVSDIESGPYALGVFDHVPDSIPIGLNTDAVYEFDLYALRAGETFGIYNRRVGEIRAGGNLPVTNDFTFGRNFTFNSVGWYTTADSSQFEVSSTNVDTPVDIFFGEMTVDTSQPIDGPMPIDMVRNVFAYDLVVSNLTSGALSVNVGSTSTIFTAGPDSTEMYIRAHRRQFWSSTLDFPSDPYAVEVIKYDTVGDIVIPTSLFDDPVDFTRLSIKSILIDAGGDQERSIASLDVAFEDTPLTKADTLFID